MNTINKSKDFQCAKCGQGYSSVDGLFWHYSDCKGKKWHFHKLESPMKIESMKMIRRLIIVTVIGTSLIILTWIIALKSI